MAQELSYESLAKLCLERIVSAHYAAARSQLGERDGIP